MLGMLILGSRRYKKQAQTSAPYSRGEQKRQAILGRAVKIAAGEGLGALTIGRLAKELRMSKSGLFAHFRSKQELELATVEKAKEVLAEAVLRPAQAGREGIERLWTLCDLWLEHIERPVFSGAYFFTGALFEYGDRRGPVARAITGGAQEWFKTLRKAVQEAQEREEIDPAAESKQVARELNGRLIGAHWAYLVEGGDHSREAREVLLGRLRELATNRIPASAFNSVGAWNRYLRTQH
jgi:AcrR family transcriptional regulator